MCLRFVLKRCYLAFHFRTRASSRTNDLEGDLETCVSLSCFLQEYLDRLEAIRRQNFQERKELQRRMAGVRAPVEVPPAQVLKDIYRFSSFFSTSNCSLVNRTVELKHLKCTRVLSFIAFSCRISKICKGEVVRATNMGQRKVHMNYFIYTYISSLLTGRYEPQQIDLAPNVWLHSSVGRASHRYRGGHGFESRWSPDFFFSGFFFPVA